MKIRNFKKEDYKDIFKNYSSDEDNLKYMLCKIHRNIEDAKNAVNYFVTNPNIYAIEENDEVIGMFTFTINEKHNFAEISYCLSKNFQGRGIMGNVLTQFIDKAKDKNVHMIMAEVMEENDSSSKLLLKYGFELDGIIREKYKDRNGVYHNIKVFTKLIWQMFKKC